MPPDGASGCVSRWHLLNVPRPGHESLLSLAQDRTLNCILCSAYLFLADTKA